MTKFKVPAHKVLIKIAQFGTDLNVSADLVKLGFTVEHAKGEGEFVKSATERGEVVQIGPLAWKHPDYMWGTDLWEPWCKVGDKVVFAKYAGKIVQHPDTKEDFMLINDEDIQLVLVEE